MNLISIIFVIQSLLNFPAGKDDGVLPVELYYFFAEIKSDHVLLKWGTATEVDNYGFNVERSSNLQVWTSLDFLPGYGTSNIPRDYSYEDTTVTSNSTYYYRLQQIDIIGSFTYSDTITVFFVTAIRELNDISEPNFYLFQNYPNPFNSLTKIKFAVNKRSDIKLSIFDLLGNEIFNLVNKEMQPGVYEVDFNSGLFPELTSGIYLYKLSGGDFSETKKFVLLK